LPFGNGVASPRPGTPSGPNDRADVGFLPPLGEFILPGLLIGIPVGTILLILAMQIGAGAAFLPAIRRWLNRPLLPDTTVPSPDEPITAAATSDQPS
jgi:hypothetical protein